MSVEVPQPPDGVEVPPDRWCYVVLRSAKFSLEGPRGALSCSWRIVRPVDLLYRWGFMEQWHSNETYYALFLPPILEWVDAMSEGAGAYQRKPRVRPVEALVNVRYKLRRKGTPGLGHFREIRSYGLLGQAMVWRYE